MRRAWHPSVHGTVAVPAPQAGLSALAAFRTVHRRRQPHPLGFAERDGPVLAGVPADRDHARLGHHVPRRDQDRLPGGQAGGAQSFGLYPHRHLPVRVPDLGAQVYLDPGYHIAGIGPDDVLEERVPGLLEVGEEHGVVDVSLAVRVTPPDRDQALKHRGESRARAGLGARWPRGRRTAACCRRSSAGRRDTGTIRRPPPARRARGRRRRRLRRRRSDRRPSRAPGPALPRATRTRTPIPARTNRTAALPVRLAASAPETGPGARRPRSRRTPAPRAALRRPGRRARSPRRGSRSPRHNAAPPQCWRRCGRRTDRACAPHTRPGVARRRTRRRPGSVPARGETAPPRLFPPEELNRRPSTPRRRWGSRGTAASRRRPAGRAPRRPARSDSCPAPSPPPSPGRLRAARAATPSPAPRRTVRCPRSPGPARTRPGTRRAPSDAARPTAGSRRIPEPGTRRWRPDPGRRAASPPSTARLGWRRARAVPPRRSSRP